MKFLTWKRAVVKWKLLNMPWETVLVSCSHLVKFLFYPRFSTVNCVFEGTFLPHHLWQCPASLLLWHKQENIVNVLPTKALACPNLPQISYRGLYIKVLQCAVHCRTLVEELCFNRPHWQTGLSTFLPKICKIVFLFAIDRMCQVISMMNKYVNFVSCTANPFLEGYSISIRLGMYTF